MERLEELSKNGEMRRREGYRNLLLDKDVAQSLSQSFVKILRTSAQNSNLNNKLRNCILENIRRLCTIDPVGHLYVDESLTEALTKLYTTQIDLSRVDSVEKELDAFLVRRYKALNINSQYDTSVNPEIVRALLNLNINYGINLQMLSKDIIHWDTNKTNYLSLLKSFWNVNQDQLASNTAQEDVAIKMKPQIEKILLNTCYDILKNRDMDYDQLFSSNCLLLQLIKKSSISSECFQISCNVLNFIFIMTNFDPQLQIFIPKFVKQVKFHCPQITFSVLYPVHINHIVVLLDFEVNELPEPLKNNYVTPSLKYLENLRAVSEYEFILLLSHFPQWFDIYFKSSN